MNAKPIVKWAGGKRQLVETLKMYMPKNYNNYYEPFVGGGALLLSILPENATISDVNSELISIYKCLSDERYFKLLLNELDIHEKKHCEEYYYKIREMDRDSSYTNLPMFIRASRAIYLNKSCFNGLYRVNKNGYFNVPSGKKQVVRTYEKDNIIKVHEYFISHNIKIKEGDFSETLKEVKANDFVYLDPPYDTLEDKNSFTSYTKDDFTKEDQIRLANEFKKLTKKGAYVMLSNHNTKFIRELYDGFNIYVTDAKRMINSDSKGRGTVEEVIITNYDIK